MTADIPSGRHSPSTFHFVGEFGVPGVEDEDDFLRHFVFSAGPLRHCVVTCHLLCGQPRFIITAKDSCVALDVLTSGFVLLGSAATLASENAAIALALLAGVTVEYSGFN